jgi:hypothetical protein
MVTVSGIERNSDQAAGVGKQPAHAPEAVENNTVIPARMVYM